MTEFKYDESRSYDDNFYRWWGLNSTERREFLEEPYHAQKARMIFNKKYSSYEKNSMFEKMKRKMDDFF